MMKIQVAGKMMQFQPCLLYKWTFFLEVAICNKLKYLETIDNLYLMSFYLVANLNLWACAWHERSGWAAGRTQTTANVCAGRKPLCSEPDPGSGIRDLDANGVALLGHHFTIHPSPLNTESCSFESKRILRMTKVIHSSLTKIITKP